MDFYRNFLVNIANDTIRKPWRQPYYIFGILSLMRLRESQAEILKYQHGRLAVSAVPGSGKTFILSLLATELLADSRLDVETGQQVLIVTYLNSSVETFQERIRANLQERNLPQLGFDVRTLHSLALEIVRAGLGSSSVEVDNLVIADESQTTSFVSLAVIGWINANRPAWDELLSGESPQDRVRWQAIIEKIARTYIREAKNSRYSPRDVLERLNRDEPRVEDYLPALPQIRERGEGYTVTEFPLTGMLADIYSIYQSALMQQSALDFDDLIWRAADLMSSNPALQRELRKRWPFVLEDEAQDSVPLQELLLDYLTGESGNWVRVGDPNQAITSTFTAAHPRYFNNFLDRSDVKTLPLPRSGRNAPRILGAANTLVRWVSENHPVSEVRDNAFRRQIILPAPEDDAQPNPPDDESNIQIRVFSHREEEELPGIAQLAQRYVEKHPNQTLAILVPTNYIGHKMAQCLDTRDLVYDNLLRSNVRIKEIAASFNALISMLVDPLNTKALAETYSTLEEQKIPSAVDESIDADRIRTILISVHRPEAFLFAENSEQFNLSLPKNIANEEEIRFLSQFAKYLRAIFQLRPLAFDDLILSIADELFASSNGQETTKGSLDLALAYQLAGAARTWLDIHPEWRLPEINAQLSSIARGSQTIFISAVQGYKPEPGRITLSTQHGAKGMEWDAVFLLGVDSQWIPGNLDAHFIGIYEPVGGDPSAEAVAQLRHLMDGDAGLFPGRTATQTAHIEVICERLRLLYVGITRARRFLHISRSRKTRYFEKEIASEPATVMAILYQYISQGIAG